MAEDERIIMSNGMNSVNIQAESTLNDRPYGSNVLHVFYVNEDGDFVDRCVICLGCMYDKGEVVEARNGNTFTEEDARNVAMHIATENANADSIARQLGEEGVI